MSMPVPFSRIDSKNLQQDSVLLVPNQRSGDQALSMSASARLKHLVLIADRDPMSSEMLAQALARDRIFDAFPIRSSDLIQQLSGHEAEVIVIGADQEFRSGNGLDLASEVARLHPDTMIVIILNEPTHALIVQAFRCGARGVICRNQPIAQFISCIEHVSKGFIWAGREETNSILEAFKSIPSQWS